MAFGITAKLEGDTEIFAKLDGLPDKLKKRGLKKAVTAGCQVVNRRAKDLCPVDEEATKGLKGLLKKSLGYVVRNYRGGSTVVGVIGPRTGKKVTVTTKTGKQRTEDPANIAHLVELGHGGPQPAPAHPFMRPAWDGVKAEAEEKMNETVLDFIDENVGEYRGV